MRRLSLLLLPLVAATSLASASTPVPAVGELTMAPPIALAPLAAARALASFGAEQRDKAMLLLSGYHGIGSKADFEAALAEPEALLASVARDGAVDPVHRDRALAALVYWPGEQTLALYGKLLAADDTSEMNRHRIIGYLAVGYADRSIPWVEHYLTVSDLQFRLTAIEALRTIGSDHARDLLTQAEVVELSPLVIERIKVARASILAGPKPR